MTPVTATFSTRQPVSIIGSSEADPNSTAYVTARQIAVRLAHAGIPVLCGGRGGVMDAACLGARTAGGLAIGILPGSDISEGNPHASVLIPSGLGNASAPVFSEPFALSRNWLIAHGGACLIAVAGGIGTEDEIRLGLKFGKRIFATCGAPIPKAASEITVYPDSRWSNLVDEVISLCGGPPVAG
jgi:uncharacterized protein (TIGR00725 family)